jgi:hypothetical protein
MLPTRAASAFHAAVHDLKLERIARSAALSGRPQMPELIVRAPSQPWSKFNLRPLPKVQTPAPQGRAASQPIHA